MKLEPLVPVLGFIVGWLGAWLLSPVDEPSLEPAGSTAASAEALVSTPPIRCPTASAEGAPAVEQASAVPAGPPGASEGADAADAPVVPAGWDPLADEQRLWAEGRAFARELGRGDLAVLDCARWPCIGVLAWPGEDVPDYDALQGALRARWPDAKFEQSAWNVDGVDVEAYTMVFGDGPLHPDQEREVRLRRIALDLEASDALDEFAAGLEAP